MNNSPLISIITPTYNHERFIRQCIESVLSQTYKNWEMIIIDDDSKDNTAAIIEEYQEKDERIHIIKQKHKGIWKLGRTYNRALRFSDGHLIAILEGDDFWPPRKLEVQLRGFKNKNIVLTWGKAYLFLNGQIITEIPKKIDLLRINNEKYYLQQLLIQNYIPAVTVMIKREALELIGGFKQRPYTPYVDYTTWLQLTLIGKFYFVNDILGYWRKHSGQTTSKATLEIARARRVSMEFIQENLCELKKRKVDVKDIKQRIQKDYEKGIAVAYFMKSLSEKDRNKASFYLDEALFRGNITIKLRSLLLKRLKKVPRGIILPKIYYSF